MPLTISFIKLDKILERKKKHITALKISVNTVKIKVVSKQFFKNSSYKYYSRNKKLHLTFWPIFFLFKKRTVTTVERSFK